MKKIVIAGLIAISVILTACQPAKRDKNTLIVGVMAGPEAQLMLTAKEVAKKDDGLNVVVQQFSDYAMPNAALASGSIDANMFQHVPYLQNAIKHRHYKLSVIGKTFIYPMAIYSHKIKNLSQLPKGAIVAIPNDPSNGARALLLLQQAKLIKLRAGSGANANLTDVIANSQHLQLKELNAAQLPRVLNTATIAVINTNYAVPAGLNPQRDGLLSEDKESLYANVVVARTADKDRPQLQQLVKALHSPAVLAKAKQLFNGTAIAAW